MRQIILAFLTIICLSSCLKESIADAMMAEQNANLQNAPGAASMSYSVNGNTVTNTVTDPDGQPPYSFQLGFSKTLFPNSTAYYYSLDCLTASGEMTFTLMSGDSLRLANYDYTGQYFADMFVLSYNGLNAYVHDPSDSISINITAVINGHVSGNFSGRLTPVTAAGYPNNTYGTPGSVLITKGSFKNVPVFE